MDEQIRCVMAGQTYAKNAFTKFTSSINNCDEIKTKLYYYGRSYLTEFGSAETKNVVNKGWVSSEKIVGEIAQYDFAFLPYFGDENKIVSDLSFPSKLVVYASAKIPILYIGGKDSAAYEVIKNYDIGMAFDIKEFENADLRIILKYLSGLKSSRFFQGNMERLNNELFSKNALVSALREVKLCGIDHSLREGVNPGAYNTVADFWYTNSVVPESPLASYKSYKKYFKKFINFLDIGQKNKLLGTSQNIIFKEIINNRLKFEVLNYGEKKSNLSQVTIDKSTSSEEIKNMTRGFGNNHIILTLTRFDHYQKSFTKYNLHHVIEIINPIKSNKQIIMKPALSKAKGSRITILDNFSVSDAYLLSLLGPNLCLIISTHLLPRVFNEVLKLIQNKELDSVNILSYLFSLLENYHIHDPFIKIPFRIHIESRVASFSREDLIEIYKKCQFWENNNSHRFLDEHRTLSRFINFLKILGYSEVDVKNFIKYNLLLHIKDMDLFPISDGHPPSRQKGYVL
jgi:hypothetical protein